MLHGPCVIQLALATWFSKPNLVSKEDQRIPLDQLGRIKAPGSDGGNRLLGAAHGILLRQQLHPAPDLPDSSNGAVSFNR